VVKLVQQGQGLNNVDIENLNEKLTPFFMAVLQGLTKLADKLTSVRLANPNRVNSDGKTIQDLA
jgi:hypothetical protein